MILCRYPPLLLELKKVVDRNFNPPANYWDTSDLIVTVGSQNALHAVLAMVLSRGDPLAIQQPCYSSALSIVCFTTCQNQFCSSSLHATNHLHFTVQSPSTLNLWLLLPLFLHAFYFLLKMDPYFPSYIPLPDDDKGMQPQLLRAALKEWYEKNSATGRPADTPNRPKVQLVLSRREYKALCKPAFCINTKSYRLGYPGRGKFRIL